MKYKIEKYKNCERFNDQYQEIYEFLLEAESLKFNEHFHWGRFEWMHGHSMLEKDKLDQVAMFKDTDSKIVGLVTHDTWYGDRVYLIHTITDETLLNEMIDFVLEREDDNVVIKVNNFDDALCKVLKKRQFEKKNKDVRVLELDLSKDLSYNIPTEYWISPLSMDIDLWQYQLAIHKGFDQEGIPEKWDDELVAPKPHEDEYFKTFAIKNEEYCSHCGLWYMKGDTAYVEPVATVPQHRKLGLAKAAIYESCKRAKIKGAKRAIVLSDQEFYYRIGFECSSEVYCWEKSF